MIHKLCSGFNLGFLLSWQPKFVCIKARALILLYTVPEAEFGLGCDSAGQGNGIFVSQILLCGGSCCCDPVCTAV